MPNSRVTKLAEVLVQYSVGVQPGEQMLLTFDPQAKELGLAVYEEAVKAGAHVLILSEYPGQQEIFYRNASEDQLMWVSPVTKLMAETFDTTLNISAPANTRELSGIAPELISKARQAQSELMGTFMRRAATGDLRWCTTVYPCPSLAQEADMSLREYADFVYGAGLIDLDDPVAAWRAEGERQSQYIEWLKGKRQVVLKGANIDMEMSIEGRTFVQACGHHNFPDGEIYTGPVENSANGWVRFAYPGIYGGQEVVDIELWFEDGKIVKENAAKGQELLTALLDTDGGSRYLGELGIGTNYGIQRFTKNMLFDEKIGGTIHLAVGRGYPETGSRNESAIHWDMLCDMAEGQMLVDGEVFYENGKIVM